MAAKVLVAATAIEAFLLRSFSQLLTANKHHELWLRILQNFSNDSWHTLPPAHMKSVYLFLRPDRHYTTCCQSVCRTLCLLLRQFVCLTADICEYNLKFIIFYIFLYERVAAKPAFLNAKKVKPFALQSRLNSLIIDDNIYVCFGFVLNFFLWLNF